MALMGQYKQQQEQEERARKLKEEAGTFQQADKDPLTAKAGVNKKDPNSDPATSSELQKKPSAQQQQTASGSEKTADQLAQEEAAMWEDIEKQQKEQALKPKTIGIQPASEATTISYNDFVSEYVAKICDGSSGSKITNMLGKSGDEILNPTP